MNGNVWGFVGYASDPEVISHTIEPACKQYAGAKIESWPQIFEPGEFIKNNILEKIDNSNCCFFDVSVPNFNVFYEAGYAIGKGKAVIPIVNAGLSKSGEYLNELGIFDTIGFQKYTNSSELQKIFSEVNSRPIFSGNSYENNSMQPLYLVDAYRRTEFAAKVVSAIKEHKTHFRTFDPSENYRMSAHEAITGVATSVSVITTILPKRIEDAESHNLRSAFVSGLADGMGKLLLILNYIGSEPTPLDIRDYVKAIWNPNDIGDYVGPFAHETLVRNQQKSPISKKKKKNLLQKLSIGAPAAENEFRDLEDYFIETHQFRQTLSGQAQIVAGRKGTGKTAIFWQVRDRKRANNKNLVLDLKPEGYQLRKFKDQLVRYLSAGTKEHTVTAFWEYLLYLEISHKILESDSYLIGRNPELATTYAKLEEFYSKDEYVSEGDFSERMSMLLSEISRKYTAKFAGSEDRMLTSQEVTELVYSHNFSDLRILVHAHLVQKDQVLILFDNIDKGWETEQVSEDDVLIVRTLIEALRRVERRVHKDSINFHGVVFLRNDVLEHLLKFTPDRGKEAIVKIDWNDKELLKKIIFERLSRSFDEQPTCFEDMWKVIACTNVGTGTSIDFLLDRCLMRPRSLIEIFDRCLSVASARDHEIIEEADFVRGAELYSNEALSNLNHEIKQVRLEAYDAIYSLIGKPTRLTSGDFKNELRENDFDPNDAEVIEDTLLWFGILGFVSDLDVDQYVYDFSYDFKLMKQHKQKAKVNPFLCINPAFHAALQVEN